MSRGGSPRKTGSLCKGLPDIHEICRTVVNGCGEPLDVAEGDLHSRIQFLADLLVVRHVEDQFRKGVVVLWDPCKLPGSLVVVPLHEGDCLLQWIHPTLDWLPFVIPCDLSPRLIIVVLQATAPEDPCNQGLEKDASAPHASTAMDNHIALKVHDSLGERVKLCPIGGGEVLYHVLCVVFYAQRVRRSRNLAQLHVVNAVESRLPTLLPSLLPTALRDEAKGVRHN
mmetsp:Transcript_99468/g.197108  ORF Transcript_99468/g.197108 Transcript_99468/m.197108 type:complete len:226 (-) Transcript_99468:595-1272(-)